jgi:hypothetical protein
MVPRAEAFHHTTSYSGPVTFERRADAATVGAGLAELRARSIAATRARAALIGLAVLLVASTLVLAAFRRELFEGQTLAHLAAAALVLFGRRMIQPLPRARIDAARSLLSMLALAPGEPVSLSLDLGPVERPDLRIPEDPDGFDPDPDLVNIHYDCPWLVFAARLEDGASLHFTRHERLHWKDVPDPASRSRAHVPIRGWSWLDEVEIDFGPSADYRSPGMAAPESLRQRLELPKGAALSHCEVARDRVRIAIRSRGELPHSFSRNAAESTAAAGDWVKQIYALTGRARPLQGHW